MKKRSRQKSGPKGSGKASGTRAEHLARAKKLGIRGRHQMTKSQLVRALEPYLRKKPKSPIRRKAVKSATASPSSGSSKGSSTQPYDDLPQSYGKTELVLMPVDPFLLHAYWDFSRKDWEAVRTRRKPVILRIYDITSVKFDGTNAHQSSDVPVFFEARNWYIPNWSAAKSLCADLGWLLSDGTFQSIVRSNIITAPRAGPSAFDGGRWIEIRSGRRRVIKEMEVYGSKKPSLWEKLERQAAGLTAGKFACLSSEITPPHIQDKLRG
jgi:hypothetical protein